MINNKKIAVVIPSFKVKSHILGVISSIGQEVDRIFVVDDCCPQQTGAFVAEHCTDRRVSVLYNPENLGVGGAVMTGYRQALSEGFDIAVKIDGDGQMDPVLLPRFVNPIAAGQADYTKGNRFYSIESLESMPFVRKLGNAALSFINKIASGYWGVMDPTNGYTAIHRTALSQLPFEKISERYFFESDMLFRLGTVRAVVQDVPMMSVYGDEVSNLRIGRVLVDFPPRYLKAFAKRLFYSYFLRDFNGASMQMLLGVPLFSFGVVCGGVRWAESIVANSFASVGAVMLAVLPTILGFQLLLGALHFDMSNMPTKAIQE